MSFERELKTPSRTARELLSKIEHEPSLETYSESYMGGPAMPGGGGGWREYIRVKLKRPWKQLNERPPNGQEPEPVLRFATGVAAIAAGCALPFFLPPILVGIPAAFLIGFGATIAQIGIVRFYGMGMFPSFFAACVMTGKLDNIWTSTLVSMASGGGFFGLPILVATIMGAAFAWYLDKR